MPSPVVSVVSVDLKAVEADVLVLGVVGDPAGIAPALPGFTADLAAIGVTSAAGELVRLPAPDGVAATSLALVGVGKADAGAAALRDAAASAVRRLAGTASVALALPADGDEQVAAVLEGAALGAYAYTDYRVRTLAAQKAPVARIAVVADAEPVGAVQRAAVVADAVALVKDLVNAPPNDMFPAALAERASDAASAAGLDVRVWDERALADEGFGGILGVGQGSVRPPRLVRVAWAPEGASGRVALVGKGITFDAGGLSLKTPVGMVGMKYDMTGAATVLAVAVAAARLALPIGVTAWLCIAENLPSGSAIRPNDVLRMYGGGTAGGRTVEVLNTDAEGRLVMADGIVAASAEQPDAILDVATLTGAVIGALGNRTTGVLGDEGLVGEVLTAAKAAAEPMWPLPLPEEIRALIKSDVADIANAKPGNTAGGALLAGWFLREFVGERPDGTPIPWAHLDIAGSAEHKGTATGVLGTGPTGVAVRTLLGLLEARAGGRPDAAGPVGNPR